MANGSQDDVSYRAAVDQRRIQAIREICRDLPQAASDFLRHIATVNGTFTRLAYAMDLRTFFSFLHAERAAFGEKEPRLLNDDDLARVTAADLTAYTEYLTYYIRESDLNDDSPRYFANHEISIKRKLCSIRSFYDYLFKAQRIASNVTLLVPLPKIHEKPILLLNQEEVHRLLHEAVTGDGLTKHQRAYQNYTASRDYAMLMLFLGTGIRVSECVGINLSDVDFQENAFLVTRKGGNQVMLYFPQEVADALLAYLEQRKQIEPEPGHEDAFFLSMQRRRMTQRAVQNMVKKYARIAAPLKRRISPHKLRSTFATNLYQETGDIYLVADALGHTSVDTTRKHYADMSDARRRTVASHVHLTREAEQEGTTATPPSIPEPVADVAAAEDISTHTTAEQTGYTRRRRRQRRSTEDNEGDAE
ncbi:MAG: tyrosine-type recombinase/integrase [Clostridia bacterium]|nr:tyrosine-type recombinase/integrase [Clostridia bacterium]